MPRGTHPNSLANLNASNGWKRKRPGNAQTRAARAARKAWIDAVNSGEFVGPDGNKYTVEQGILARTQAMMLGDNRALMWFLEMQHGTPATQIHTTVEVNGDDLIRVLPKHLYEAFGDLPDGNERVMKMLQALNENLEAIGRVIGEV